MRFISSKNYLKHIAITISIITLFISGICLINTDKAYSLDPSEVAYFTTGSLFRDSIDTLDGYEVDADSNTRYIETPLSLGHTYNIFNDNIYVVRWTDTPWDNYEYSQLVSINEGVNAPIYMHFISEGGILELYTPAVKVYLNPDSSYMFSNLGDGDEGMDMSGFFTNILDTSNVTNMSFMFEMCNVKSLDLSMFNTSHVTTMENMFRFTYWLEELDISSFDISSVQKMMCMFWRCAVRDLDISHFEVSHLRCYQSRTSRLSPIDSVLSQNGNLIHFKCFDWADLDNEVIEKTYTYALPGDNVVKWFMDDNENGILEQNEMIVAVNPHTKKTAGVHNYVATNRNSYRQTNNYAMLGQISDYISFPSDIYSYVEDVTNSQDSDYFQQKVYGPTDVILVSEPWENYQTDSFVVSEHETLDDTFIYARYNGSILELYTTAEKIFLPEEMVCFANIRNLQQISVLDDPRLDYSYVRSWSSAFCNDYALQSIDLSQRDFSHVYDFDSMFYRCYSLEEVIFPETHIDLFEDGTFEAEECLVSFYYMFAYCYKLREVDLSNISANPVGTLYGLCYYCPRIKSIKLGNFKMGVPPAYDVGNASLDILVHRSAYNFSGIQDENLEVDFIDFSQVDMTYFPVYSYSANRILNCFDWVKSFLCFDTYPVASNPYYRMPYYPELEWVLDDKLQDGSFGHDGIADNMTVYRYDDTVARSEHDLILDSEAGHNHCYIRKDCLNIITFINNEVPTANLVGPNVFKDNTENNVYYEYIVDTPDVKAIAPELPAKAGYSTRWYTNEAKTTEWDFNSPVTEDMTLYAGYVKNPTQNNNQRPQPNPVNNAKNKEESSSEQSDVLNSNVINNNNNNDNDSEEDSESSSVTLPVTAPTKSVTDIALRTLPKSSDIPSNAFVKFKLPDTYSQASEPLWSDNKTGRAKQYNKNDINAMPASGNIARAIQDKNGKEDANNNTHKNLSESTNARKLTSSPMTVQKQRAASLKFDVKTNTPVMQNNNVVSQDSQKDNSAYSQDSKAKNAKGVILWITFGSLLLLMAYIIYRYISTQKSK